MMAVVPAERVAEILIASGYRRIPPPLQIAGVSFDLAAAFVGVDRSADLVIIGDMAADGERKVVQQIEGVARALDVMRSHRPFTTVIVGPRPVGRAFEALAQVSRILPVEEAADPAELRDRLAALLPLELPSTLTTERDFGIDDEIILPETPFAAELVHASLLGKEEVQVRFHAALMAILQVEERKGELEDNDEKEKAETRLVGREATK